MISAHASRFKQEGDLVLWDVHNKRKKVLANNANAYEVPADIKTTSNLAKELPEETTNPKNE